MVSLQKTVSNGLCMEEDRVHAYLLLDRTEDNNCPTLFVDIFFTFYVQSVLQSGSCVCVCLWLTVWNVNDFSSGRKEGKMRYIFVLTDKLPVRGPAVSDGNNFRLVDDLRSVWCWTQFKGRGSQTECTCLHANEARAALASSSYWCCRLWNCCDFFHLRPGNHHY